MNHPGLVRTARRHSVQVVQKDSPLKLEFAELSDYTEKR